MFLKELYCGLHFFAADCPACLQLYTGRGQSALEHAFFWKNQNLTKAFKTQYHFNLIPKISAIFIERLSNTSDFKMTIPCRMGVIVAPRAGKRTLYSIRMSTRGFPKIV